MLFLVEARECDPMHIKAVVMCVPGPPPLSYTASLPVIIFKPLFGATSWNMG